MRGKHYNRSMHVHKIVLEAIQRFLLDIFEKSDLNVTSLAKVKAKELSESLSHLKIADDESVDITVL